MDRALVQLLWTCKRPLLIGAAGMPLIGPCQKALGVGQLPCAWLMVQRFTACRLLSWASREGSEALYASIKALHMRMTSAGRPESTWYTSAMNSINHQPPTLGPLSGKGKSSWRA